MAVALCSAFASAAQNTALPAGGQVIAGQASFTQNGQHLLVTTQNAAGKQHSAINWQSFSVGAGHSAHFQQPNASSTVINRVVAPNPSQLLGQLGSNGHLVLVNPHGIAVGQGAVVDTARFTASTLQMSEADAVAGRLRFQADGTPGALNVQGQVVGRGGDVVLIAPNVEVGAQAVVQSQGGAVVLAAGQKVEITGRGLEGIHLEVQAPGDTAVNLGTLKGDAVGIFAGTLRHSGVIQAQTATLEGGRVVLKVQKDLHITLGAVITADGAPGQAGGHVTITAGEQALVAGTVSAQSLALPADTVTVPPSARGGRVEILGREVKLEAGAGVDVSGDAGGGTILVGGDLQGKNAEIPNAESTSVAPGVALVANARAYGNGGTVIVWADEATDFAGHLSAQGGEYGGNGGFGETSGKSVLYFRGTADLTARRGKRGMLLLDPLNIEVVASGPDIDGNGTTGDDIAGGGDLDDAANDHPGVTSKITAGALASLLDRTDVTLAATNNITVSSAITKTASTAPATTLTLTANTVTINADIGATFASSPLNLTLNASGGTTLNARFKNGTLTTAAGTLGGSMSLENVKLGGNVTLTSGWLSIYNSLTLAAGSTLDAGNVTLYAYGTPTIGVASGSATVLRSGGVTYVNADNSAGALVLGSGLTWSGHGGFYDYHTGGTLVNNGTIDSNVTGQAQSIGTTSFTNNGEVKASAGDVDMLPANWSNNGTFGQTAGTFTVGGNGVASGLLGRINRTGGTFTLGSGTLDLQGGSLDIGSATFGTGGLSNVSGVTFKGGTLLSSDGTALNGNSVWDTVAIGGNTLSLAGGGWVDVYNGLALASGTTLDAGSNDLYFYGTQSVRTPGTATLISAGALFGPYGSSGTDVLTLASGLTIEGSPYLYGKGGGGIVNNGVIMSTVSGQSASIDGTFLNNGVVRLAGGDLYVVPTFVNGPSGALINDGGTLYLANGFSSSGSILINAGVTELGGSYTLSSFANWRRTAGDLYLSAATLDLQGGALDVGAAGILGAGGLGLDGATLKNGTLLNSGGGSLYGYSATIEGVAIGNSLSSSVSYYDIQGGLALADGVTFDVGSAGLYFYGSQSISTPGAATLQMNGGYVEVDAGAAAGTLTIAGGVTVRGSSVFYDYSGGGTLINNGVLLAEGYMDLDTTNFVNNGKILLNNATVSRSGDLINYGTISGSGDVYLYGSANTLVNKGVLEPGGAGVAGSLYIDGNLDTSAGTLSLELGSAASYDRVAVSGNITLGSSTAVKLAALPGASYVAGDTFDILESWAGVINGSAPWVAGFTSAITPAPAPVYLQVTAQAAPPVGTPPPAPAPTPAPAPAEQQVLEIIQNEETRAVAQAAITEQQSQVTTFTTLLEQEEQQQTGGGADGKDDVKVIDPGLCKP